MSRLVWDAAGEKAYESGVDHGVLYPLADNVYNNGVVWNGLTSISESPEGGDANDFYADNIKYGTLRGTENFGGTIEAYTYPDEFAICDGSASLADGVIIGQQTRKTFGLSYRTLMGNDADGLDAGYKLHLVYGATASPSEKSYETINDSPEAITFSWEFTTIPVPVTGTDYKPISVLVIDSTKADEDNLETLENILYGSNETIYVPTQDQTKQQGKTYYTRSGAGTTESPYTYSVFSGSEFAVGTTYYEATTPGPRLPLPAEVKQIMEAE